MTHFGRAASLAIVALVIGFGSLISAQGGTGSISGVITEADGVTPVSGVHVSLDGVSASQAFYQVWTGANGVYQFPSVTPGLYVLCADHTRYMDTCHDGKRGTRTADAITIASGDALTNFSVRMPRRAVVSGRVFAPNGTGVKTQLSMWANPSLLTPSATTGEPNADGTFTIYVDPGTFTLSAHHTTYGRMFYGGALSRADAAQISVQNPGDVLSGIYIYYAAPGSLTGTITDAASAGGTPIPNATVSLYRQTSGLVYASAMTDATGVYNFFNLPNDVFHLSASAPGFVPEIYNDAPSLGYASYIAVQPAPAIQTANLQLERTGDVTGRIYAPNGVTPLANRRMIWQSDFPSGIDSGGTFCTNASGDYTIADAPLNRLFYVFMDGYRCDNAQPLYKAEYWDDSTSMTNAIPLWAHDTVPLTGINFVTQTTATPGPIPTIGGGGGGSPDGDRSATTGSIGGAIYAPDGVTPLRGWVDLFRVQGNSTTLVRGMGTESIGEYWFQFLPPGTYKLRVKPQGYLSEYYPDATSLDDAATLTVVAGEELRQINFIVNPGAILTGTVYDSATGLRALYPSIRVVDADGQEVEWGGSAHEDGTFEVVVPPGLYTIFADNTTYGAGRFYGGSVRLEDAWTVSAVADLPVSGLNITLGRRGEVTGTVFAPDGTTGVANVSVRISQPGNPFSYTACTNSRGLYRHAMPMLDVPNIVSVDGYCDGSPFPYLREFWEDVHNEGTATPVMVHDRQRYATGINFTLEPGGSISGVITGGALPGLEDEPVIAANAVVEVFEGEANTDEGVLVATVSADADGSYTVNGLPTGHYRVRATAPGYVYEYYGERFILWESPPVSVTAGAVTPDIDIELDPALTVSGTVYAEDGTTPLENVPVTFYAEWYDKQVWCTEADGTYTIDKAPSNAVFTIGAADDRQQHFTPYFDYMPTPNPCDPANSSYVQAYYGGQTGETKGDPFAYEPDGETSITGIDIRVVVGGRILVNAKREDGTPYPNVLMSVAYPTDEYLESRLSGGSDAAGTYRSILIPPGNYTVTSYSMGNTSNEPISQSVTVTPGTTTAVTLTATRDIGTASISGTFYEPDGVTPVEGVAVSLDRSNYFTYARATTDAAGHYEFNGLIPGTYRVYGYSYRGFRGESYINVPYPGTGTAITLAAGQARTDINVVFDGNITISGQLIDEVNGLPYPGGVYLVAISTTNSNVAVGFITDIDGTYRFTLPEPGSYVIRTTQGRHAVIVPPFGYRNPPDSPTNTPITVTAGQTLANFDLTVPRSAEITGRVANAMTDNPITDALLGYRRSYPSEMTSTAEYYASTNANGFYWYRMLPSAVVNYIHATGAVNGSNVYTPEWWEEAPSEALSTPLTFTPQNRAHGGIDFTLVTIGTPVTLNGGVTLQGRPTAPDPEWVMPVHVVITPAAGGAAVYDQTISTDESGVFTVSGIAPGRYVVWVKGEATLAVTQTVTLAAGPTEVDFSLLKAGDADGNNQIGLSDFSILANTFGKQEGDEGYDARADFNGDGIVSLVDFSLLASNYGQMGAAP